VRRLAILTLLLGAAAVAGCGGSTDSAADFEGEQKAIAEVIEDLEQASADDEPGKICRDLLAQNLVRAASRGCERAIDQALEDADVYALKVTKIEPARITPQTREATATVEAGREEDQVEKITLVREGRAWKISRLAGR
jgi:hypothetical protein